jgi:hypothetical protein
MAETGCVFDVIAQQPRTPEQVMRELVKSFV